MVMISEVVSFQSTVSQQQTQ